MDRRTFIRRMLAAGFLTAAAAGGAWKYGFELAGERASSNHAQPGEKGIVLGNPDDTTGSLLSFMILSDLHINSAVSYPSENFRHALEDMKAFESKIESIFLTGDITESATENDYKEFRAVVSPYKLPPIYANMGNHDYYNIWIDKNGGWSKETMPNGKSDQQSRQMFMEQFGLDKPYSEAVINGYRLILLSQETYVQEKPDVGEGAWYSDEQLAWLKDRLASRNDNKPVFVMIHQPLPAAGRDGGNHSLIRANEFRDILKPYTNVFIFSGHTHQDFQNGREHYVKESFHWFQNSSVGRVLNAQFRPYREHVSQGLYVQVFKDKVRLRGREFIGRTWIEEADWTVSLV